MYPSHACLILTLYLTWATCYDLQEYCRDTCGREPTVVCKRHHSNCRPLTICGTDVSYRVSKPDEELILRTINKLRNIVAGGDEYRGGMVEAADMNVVSYSPELEFSAQCLCNTCKPEQDKCPMTPKYHNAGQNMFYATKGKHTFVSAISNWYDEVRNHKGGPIFTGAANTSRFSMMMWAKTDKVGCGVATFTGNYLLCCNFAPVSTAKGTKMFTPGRPCTACQGGQQCGSVYNNLCGNIDHNVDSDFQPPVDMWGHCARRSSALHVFISINVLARILYTFLRII